MDSRAAASAEIPFATARSILSFGMLAARAVSIRVRNVGEFTSPLAFFDSTVMRFDILPQMLLLAASAAPLRCFICDHLLCPDIRLFYVNSWQIQKGAIIGRHGYIALSARRALVLRRRAPPTRNTCAGG